MAAKCNKCGATLDNGTCPSCGIVWEDSAMVSDLTFGESSTGAAVVTGSFVSADRSGPDRGGLYGHGSGGSTKEITIEKAKGRIYGVAHYLKVSEPVVQAAILNFKYALSLNFVRGRKAKYVTCACLYLGCRMKKTHHMIMEFAAFLKINVFTLGKTYTKLVQALRPMLDTDQLQNISLIDPSIYIQKFQTKLNFTAENSRKVYDDAQRLVKRMKTDWMTDGRRPAGLAAAAVLIACRMNNLQRSKAQIMQIAMVSEDTIDERLSEFANTDAGTLTVKDFRATNVSRTSDPPAYTKNRIQERREYSSHRQLVRIREDDGEEDEEMEEEEEDEVEGRGRKTEDLSDLEILELAERARKFYDSEDEDVSLGEATLEAIEAAKREKERELEREREKLKKKEEESDNDDEKEKEETGSEDEAKEEDEEDEVFTKTEEMEVVDESNDLDEELVQGEEVVGTIDNVQKGEEIVGTVGLHDGEEVLGNVDDVHEGEEVVGTLGEIKEKEEEEEEEEEDDADGVNPKEEEEEEELQETSIFMSEEYESPQKPHVVPPLTVPKETMNLSRQERIELILKRHNHPMPATVVMANKHDTWASQVRDSETDLTDVDDAEIESFLCTPKEAEMRKRLWMSLHRDYEIEMAHKRNKVEADKRAGIYKEPRKRKYINHFHNHSVKLGDGENAAEVARNMMITKSKLLKVPKKSKKINYGVYDDILKLKKD